MAHMWRRVALSSKETAEQLLSYQNAIEALNVSTVNPLYNDTLYNSKVLYNIKSISTKVPV